MIFLDFFESYVAYSSGSTENMKFNRVVAILTSRPNQSVKGVGQTASLRNSLLTKNVSVYKHLAAYMSVRLEVLVHGRTEIHLAILWLYKIICII